MKKLLVWIGLIRIKDNGSVHWPIHIAPRNCWSRKEIFVRARMAGTFYVFRNPPGVIKWERGRLLPRRWGFGFFGLIEFGDRG